MWSCWEAFAQHLKGMGTACEPGCACLRHSHSQSPAATTGSGTAPFSFLHPRGAELPLDTMVTPGKREKEHLRRAQGEGRTILALKTPRDALIFATPASAQAPVGRHLNQGQIGNSPPWLHTETGGWGSGERESPAELPLVLETNHMVLSSYHLHPRPPAPRHGGQ